MSQSTTPNPGPSADTPLSVVRVTPELFLPAARRLVSQTNASVEEAAKRLVESAPRHGIDLTLCFATLDPLPRPLRGARPGRAQPLVRQACLGVKGSGRTAMLFVSEPLIGEVEGPEALDERVGCIRAALDHLARFHARDVGLAQALPEPEEIWTIQACEQAGFIRVGNLTYMRCPPIKARDAQRLAQHHDDTTPWPSGVEVLRCSDLSPGIIDDLLGEALETSYADTLDCPELSGLRARADVIDSHRSIGRYDPATWWLVTLHGKPRGCVLLSACPDQRASELVYLGLAPELRRAGLGKRLLVMGMQAVRRLHPTWGVTCAVDERNLPALRLYQGLGFEGIARRVALVRPIEATRA